MNRARVVFVSLLCLLSITAVGVSAEEVIALGGYSPKDMTHAFLGRGASAEMPQIGRINGMDAPFNVGASACAESEPNDLLTQADQITIPDTCSGTASSFDTYDVYITYSGGTKDGIEDIYFVNLGTSAKLDVTLSYTNASADHDVFIFQEAAGSLTLVGQANGSANPEHVVTTNTLSPGKYYIGVSAFIGSSAYNLTVTTQGGSGTLPNAPTNLTATATSTSVIRLNWTDNSSDELDFRVEQRNSSGTFVELSPPVSAGATQVNVSGLSPGQTATFRIRARNAAGYSSYSNEATATTQTGGTGCTANSTTVCLLNSRFRVSIAYRNQFSNPPGQTGNFVVQRLNPSATNPDTAIFGFGNPQDVEVVVRLVDARPFAPRFDLYYGGLTDVEYTVTVTDTQTGTTRTYHNNPGVVGGGVDRASFPAN